MSQGGGHTISPPPLRSPMDSQRWMDWFARLDAYLDASGRVVDKQTITAAASYTSPELEEGFRYELVMILALSSASNMIVLNWHNSSGIVKTASSHEHWGQYNGAGSASSALYGSWLSQLHTGPSIITVSFFSHRDTTTKSLAQGRSTYSTGSALAAADFYCRRNAIEDNPNFSVSSVSNFTTGWTAAGTFTGNLILTRYPFKDL